jgi:hypothetical protein
MTRGLWRYWTEKNGVDAWSARVEVRLGEWANIDQAEYERAGHQPPFWDLPLQEDYIASLAAPAAMQMHQAELRIMPMVVIAMIAIGALAAVFLIVGLRLFYW